MGDVRPFLLFSLISGLTNSYSDLNTWHMRLESGDVELSVDLFSDHSLVDSLSKQKGGHGPSGAYLLWTGFHPILLPSDPTANAQGPNMVIRRVPNLPHRLFPRNILPNNPLPANHALEGIDW